MTRMRVEIYWQQNLHALFSLRPSCIRLIRLTNVDRDIQQQKRQL